MEEKPLYPSQNQHRPLVFSPLFSISIPDGCPSPLAELIHTLNWFRVMLSLNRKLPWRLQFSHFTDSHYGPLDTCFDWAVLPASFSVSWTSLVPKASVFSWFHQQSCKSRVSQKDPGAFGFLTLFLFSFPYIKGVLSEITILVTVRICDGDLDKRSSELLWHIPSWDVIIDH